MAVKIPRLNFQVPIVSENREPSGTFQRWWQKVAETIENSVALIELNITAITTLLGITEDVAAIVDAGLNPDGTVKADKVLGSSILAGAVVTTPGSALSSSTTLSSGSYTWTDCGSVTVTTYGNLVSIRVDFDTEVIDNCKFMYRIQCDGTTIGRERGPVSVNTADEPGYTIVRLHTPTAASHTYKLQCAVNDAGDIIIHDPVFDILENKNV